MGVDPDVAVLHDVGDLARIVGGELESLRSSQGLLAARVGLLENGQLPVDPVRPEGLLYSSDLDGWELWTAYGPGRNETYGDGNNSLHHHHPNQLSDGWSDKVSLSATDYGEGVEKRFLSGALSTREKGWFFGFGDAPTAATIRFAADVLLNEFSHAVWYALWLRGKGGAGVHEVDMLEAFTAQTGVGKVTQIVHSAGAVNFLRAPWPFPDFDAGVTHNVWFECDRPGVSGPHAHIRMGIDDITYLDAQDTRSDRWWADDYGWDLIAQIQLGGNWVGDPRSPYAGFLQNGRTGKPVSEVPSWDGQSVMEFGNVMVTAR